MDYKWNWAVLLQPVATGEPSTYVLVRGGLEARLARPPYYEVVNWAEDENGDGTMSVTSSGARFSIGRAA